MASGPPASYLSNKSDEKIYKVRDAGHICNVKLGSPHVSVGKELAVHFDFDDCEQSCYAVRVAMLQNEKKLDGSLIQVSDFVQLLLSFIANNVDFVDQERIVVAATKGSSDAEFLSINLAIPHNICCSWSGPTIKV